MRTIKLKGLNNRGKTRINNFSDDGTFRLVKESNEVCNQRGNFILVESFAHNFKVGENHLVPWSGWLEVGKEVEVI